MLSISFFDLIYNLLSFKYSALALENCYLVPIKRGFGTREVLKFLEA